MLPRPNLPGSTQRGLFRLALAAGLLALIAILTGCPFFLFGTEQLPELLYHDTFDSVDERRWDYGALDGYPQDAQQVAGRVQAYGWRQFLRTKDSFGDNLEIRLEWSVINGDYQTPLQPLFGESDFRVTIDSRDVTAVLTLYEGGYDTLAIVDGEGIILAGPSQMPTIDAVRGHLVVRFDPSGDDAGVWASVPGLGLDVSALLSDSGWFHSTRVTLGVSGSWDDPRALETVYISRW